MDGSSKMKETDLLNLVFEEVESGNESNDMFFKRLASYILKQGGSVAKNRLEFHQNSQCLQITQEGKQIIFELIDD